MASGRQKPHQLHENNDPYAEGWDARKAGLSREENPYTKDIHLWQGFTIKRREVRERDQSLWTVGWEECNAALAVDSTAADDIVIEVPWEDSPDDEST